MSLCVYTLYSNSERGCILLETVKWILFQIFILLGYLMLQQYAKFEKSLLNRVMREESFFYY